MSATPLRAGDLVAERYTINERLAEAPAGWWYRALDCDVEVEVNLLTVRHALVPDEDCRDQFVGAAVAMRSVSHRHLLRLFDAGTFGDAVYVTTQLSRPGAVPGASGNSASARAGKVAEYARAVADALDAVHGAGQVHGRLVPGDIVEVAGLVKVMGAGLYETMVAGLCVPWWQGLTRFWAPEVRRGQKATPAADVYSLAAIVAEFLAGSEGVDSAMSQLAKHHRPLHHVLESSLSPAPDDRPGSPGILATRLAAAIHGDDTDNAPTTAFVKFDDFSDIAGEQAETSKPRTPPGGTDRTVVDRRAPDLMAAEGAPRATSPVRGSSTIQDAPPAAGKQALQFVSMKPPSEQGTKRTPVIPAIDRPELKPKIRPVTNPHLATVRPGSLGHYAPPRGSTQSDGQGHMQRRTWLYVIVAAALSATLAAIVTLAISGNSDPGTPGPDAGAADAMTRDAAGAPRP